MPRPARTDGPARVTIADVAARAGVSLSTVSRALNGNPTVDPALAERVKDAAAALDYTASPVARSLVLGRTQTVAVIVPDLGNPTFQAILRGLSRAAAADDYHVLVADSAESVEEERVLAGAQGWVPYWGFLALAGAACIAAPVAGYVAWSYWGNGESGLRSHEGPA